MAAKALILIVCLKILCHTATDSPSMMPSQSPTMEPTESSIAPTQNILSFTVEATTETTKLYGNLTNRSPDCDDAAVIVNIDEPSKSYVIGTLKEGGLQLYNLDGETLQSIPAPSPPNNDSNNKPGRFNNVGVIQNDTDFRKSIVIVSDRGLDQLRFYKLGTDDLLYDVTNTTVPYVWNDNQEQVNKQETAYGLTAIMYNDVMYAIVSKRSQALVGKVRIDMLDNGLFSYERIETLQLPIEFDQNWTACTSSNDETPQIEGLVVDPYTGTLLISQEDIGLYRTNMGTFNDSNALVSVDRTTTFGMAYTRTYNDTEEEYICEYSETDILGQSGNIIADSEGISLYYTPNDSGYGYYVLSSQGQNRFEIYTRNNTQYLGHFQIKFGADYVQNTDGVEIVNYNFNSNYPNGILIVQDEGNNDDTNFKFVSFQKVLDKIEETDVTTTNKPNNGGNNNNNGNKKVVLIIMISVGVIAILIIGIVIARYCMTKDKEVQNYVKMDRLQDPLNERM